MRRMDTNINNISSNHRRESYIGPLASTSDGGKDSNVNNMHNSQIRGMSMMPYGISSRPKNGMKAQTIVNDDNDCVTLGVFDKNRPDVGVGETCIYSSGGCRIYLSGGGTITVKSGGSNIEVKKSGDININSTGNVNINCGTLNVSGNMNVAKSASIGASLSVSGTTMNVP